MLAGGCCQGEIELLNIKNLHLSSDHATVEPHRVPLQTTDWANSHISRHITRNISGFAACVGETHILSGLHVLQSRVYSQDDTFPPLYWVILLQMRAKYKVIWAVRAHRCWYHPADRMWGWRRWFQFDWFISSVTPFLWIISSWVSRWILYAEETQVFFG